MRAKTASIVAAALATLWLCKAPTDARAGTYVVHACRANGVPAPLDGWSTESSGEFDPNSTAPRRIFDDCGSGAGFGIDYGSSAGQNVKDVWRVTAPPDTRITGVRLDDPQVNMYYPGLPLPFGGDNPQRPVLLQSSGTDFGSLDASSFSLWMDCDPGCGYSPGAPTMAFRIPEAELTLRDDSPPAVSAPVQGTALQEGPISGVVTMLVPFRDRGSGVSAGDVLVDGISADLLKLGGSSCAAPFVHLVPCPLGGVATLQLDTAALSNGQHRLDAVLTDAGGNTATEGPFQIHVENPQTSSPVSFPAISAATESAAPAGRLMAGLGLHRAKKLTVRYAAPPVIRGRVTRSGGKPLAGADVQWAVEAARAPTGFVAQRAVPTDDSGRFSIRLPRGPSRTVRLSYGSSTVTLRVEVRAPVRLGVDHRATRNGRRIRFTGSVLGAPATARTLIELQAWAGRWTTFETALLKQGRFSASYRFTRTFATTRYRFRAVLRADSQLPYATGWSPQVSVLVRR